MVSVIADDLSAVDLEDEILDLAAQRAGGSTAFERARRDLVEHIRHRVETSKEPEDYFLLGRALWSLYTRPGTERAVEALRAFRRSRMDPDLEQMSRLFTLYILESRNEHSAALLEFECLDREWFERHDLYWRWLTALECQFSALVSLRLSAAAIETSGEIVEWLSEQDEIDAAPPKVFVDALEKGIRTEVLPERDTQRTWRRVKKLLDGTGMAWVMDRDVPTATPTVA